MPKAIKNHKCECCGLTINAGEDYHRKDYAPWELSPDSDPGYFSFKAHNECNEFYNLDQKYWWSDSMEHYQFPAESGESSTFRERMNYWKSNGELPKW